MDPVFRKTTITSIPLLLTELRPVRFPDPLGAAGSAPDLEAVTVIKLKRDIRRNAELLICYSYAQLRSREMLDPDVEIIVNQLLRDAHEVRRECGKVSVNFLRPKHQRILSRLKDAYEEMRLAAIIVCQQSEPTLIDSLTVSL
jgi:hypothetical protein